MRRPSPTPRDPFDALPPADRKKFVAALRNHVNTAVASLSAFSRSIQSGGDPEWPPQTALSLFMKQIEAFRLISTRSPNARPIHLIRELDHRYPRMRISSTLNRAISSLEIYIGCSLLAEDNARAIEQRRDPKNSELRSLILKRRTANPADLELMANLLPNDFQAMAKLATTRTLGVQIGGAPRGSVDKLRTALARLVQEYLFTKHQLYIARLQAARQLREFIHQLQYRPYTKRLLGFSSEHIKLWDKADRRELSRKRQQRLRAKKSRHLP
jgi:hypothetical protein